METQKNLGADEVSVARNALRDAQCACAAASISAGRYGCMLRVWLVRETLNYTDSAPLDLRPRFATLLACNQREYREHRKQSGGNDAHRLEGDFPRRQYAEQDHRHVGDQHSQRGSRDDGGEVVEACGQHYRRDLRLVSDLGQKERDYGHHERAEMAV